MCRLLEDVAYYKTLYCHVPIISQFLRGKLIAKLNDTNIDTTHYQYSALAGN